jgi:GNAT superfamily N-acetyltransferase
MDYSIKILPIMPEDLPTVVRLCEQSHGESMFSNLPFAVNKVRRNLITFITDDAMFFAMKATLNGKIIGFHFGQKGEMTFSDASIGVERGLYVVPESRGTRAFFLMVEAFYKWCDERGLIGPDYIINHSKDNNRAYAACEKMGMVDRGRIYERVVH